jgi:type I restriction enzyme M protein
MNQDLKKTLWAAADKLHASMDAADYKHIVLGLTFLKYISDAFDERRTELEAAFADESHDLYLPDTDDRTLAAEERDCYTMANVFWVPGPARWESIRANAKQADIGTRIDRALDAIEADNPRLKGILDKRFGRAQLEPGKLGELIDLISTIGFTSTEGHHAKDLLGEVYEYLRGQVASAEGKKGGHRPRVALPSGTSIAAAAGPTLRVLQARIAVNDDQAKVLGELRDTLLPRLISGRLRLPEARAIRDEVPA